MECFFTSILHIFPDDIYVAHNFKKKKKNFRVKYSIKVLGRCKIGLVSVLTSLLVESIFFFVSNWNFRYLS